MLVNMNGKKNMTEKKEAPVRLSPYHKNLAREILKTGKYGSLTQVTCAGIDLLAKKEKVKL